MLKKCCCVLLLASCLAGSARAQFMHSVGGTLTVMHTRIGPEASYVDNITLAARDVTYFPRYNVMESGNSSISVGVPLGLGFGSVSNYSDGSTGLYFGFDAPLVLDFHDGPSDLWSDLPVIRSFFIQQLFLFDPE